MAEPKTMGGTAAANEYMEPTRGTGDSVEVALKTATKSHTRDAWGKAVEEAPAIVRDAHGRRVK
jgi:hypothetical protein